MHKFILVYNKDCERAQRVSQLPIFKEKQADKNAKNIGMLIINLNILSNSLVKESLDIPIQTEFFSELP